MQWLVTLKALGGAAFDHCRVVEARHGAAAIQVVLGEWDTGDEPVVQVEARRVNG